MSEAHYHYGPQSGQPLTLEELAMAQGASAVTDLHELAEDIWESDEELEEFLADLRTARNLSLA